MQINLHFVVQCMTKIFMDAWFIIINIMGIKTAKIIVPNLNQALFQFLEFLSLSPAPFLTVITALRVQHALSAPAVTISMPKANALPSKSLHAISSNAWLVIVRVSVLSVSLDTCSSMESASVTSRTV